MSEPFDPVAMVLEFHERFGAYKQALPGIPPPGIRQLRIKLVREEFNELVDSQMDADLKGIADALGDLMYVTIGMAIAYGIDLRPVFAAIHAANMAKVGGPTREDGKILKPPGWTPPDIAEVLANQEPMF